MKLHRQVCAPVLLSCLATALWGFGLGATTHAQQPGVPITAADRAREALQLRDAQLVSVELRKPHQDWLEASVTVDGHPRTMVLRKHSVRAPGYRVMAQQADGSFVFTEPGPVSTFRGVLRGEEGSAVAAMLNEHGLFARILLANGDERWLEPLSGKLPGAARSTHALYRSEDTNVEPGGCDVAFAAEADVSTNTIGSAREAAVTAAAGTSVSVAELAADADHEFYLHWGTVAAVEDRINAIVNAINLQYERDVNIRHELTTIIVRTAEPDPYNATDAHILLTEFQNEWLQNQGSVQRDTAQLFSGREFDGGTIGVGWLNAVCGSYGFSVVESDYSTNFAFVTDLSAHELGHNWGADHCNCMTYTMNAFINGYNQFNPDLTIPVIDSFRDSRSCLDTVQACGSDADCDDLVFCNGQEYCDAGVCASTGDPCPAADCDEAAQTCVTPVCNNDGVCTDGENCDNCPADCERASGSVCGNGVCEAGAGEDCVNCASDCNGIQSGKPSARFCCGNGGANPKGCSDARCTQDGWSCTTTPGTPSCCGDGVCEGVEDLNRCPVDCAIACVSDADCVASDPCVAGSCDAGYCRFAAMDCDDGDACTLDACVSGACVYSVVKCDDRDPCSTDSCDPATGCVFLFPLCGVADGCCGPRCSRSSDPDCACGRKAEACLFDDDCCSGMCKPSGSCK